MRFATLDAKGYWQDEATTAILMDDGLWELLTSRIEESEATPPLFYALEWFAAQAFGTGEIGLRLLPALFGTAAIPFAYLAGRELASERTGVAAAALVAVNPLLVWYSQEARAYSLLVLLSAAALWCFARALTTRRRGGSRRGPASPRSRCSPTTSPRSRSRARP